MTLDWQGILLLALVCSPIYWLVWKCFYGDLENFLGSIGSMFDWETLFNPWFSEGNRAVLKLFIFAAVCIFLSWHVWKQLPAFLLWFGTTMGLGGA